MSLPCSQLFVHGQLIVWNFFCHVTERKVQGLMILEDAFWKRFIYFFFQLSIQLYKVLCLWEDTKIFHLPKTKMPKTLNESRSVTHTSLVPKTFEKLVKDTGTLHRALCWTLSSLTTGQEGLG